MCGVRRACRRRDLIPNGNNYDAQKIKIDNSGEKCLFLIIFPVFYSINSKEEESRKAPLRQAQLKAERSFLYAFLRILPKRMKAPKKRDHYALLKESYLGELDSHNRRSLTTQPDAFWRRLSAIVCV